ncbi:Hypothetical predicted protein [Octopus vulgaris]|uniref:Methyltransferase FkbM domain-containing protein n=1 Tax=Octopus vulgaris TaxID=6645 RepID=A0AA36AZ66_OCTVU|nr:Hypothetical predicted protein [Octopus vulgaris]
MYRQISVVFRYFIVTFLVAELILFNCALFYAYFMIKGALTSFSNTNGGFIDKISTNPSIKSLLEAGKDGGLSKLLEETVERVFLITYPKNEQDDMPKLTFLGVDMSNAGEFGFIYRRIQTSNFKQSRLVIDIGANDGLISSNSFNLIQLGWNAILVEPVPSQMDLAKSNTRRFVRSKKYQNVTYVEAAIGQRDGFSEFVITDDLGTMQNHLASSHHSVRVGRKSTIQVKCFSVKTFVFKYNVPKKFGVLSIDAEGTGDKILKQFIKLGFRPTYIIYEALHNSEPILETMDYLHRNGYFPQSKRGWNYIFEYQF